MKKVFTKIFAMLLTLVMLLGVMNVTAFAEEINSEIPTGGKSATLIDREENRYEIEVRVPGVDGDNRHDEIIVMVDGSYSMNEEWEDMKKAIMLIGETVLNGSGNTQLTLMSFGISPKVVLEHASSVEELQAALPATPAGLLYGRSATNCDGAFEGIGAYIAEHDDTLKDVTVIFLSDGGVNMNSEPIDWIATSQLVAASSAKSRQQNEFAYAAYGITELSDATRTIYGDELDAIWEKWLYVCETDAQLGALDAQRKTLDPASEEYAAVQAQFDAVLAENTAAFNYVAAKWNETDESGKTNAQRWVTQIFKDFYAAAGMDVSQPYPVYAAEIAYTDYERENNLYLTQTFYDVLSKASCNHDRVGSYGYYAGAEAAKVAQMDEVANMYVIRFESWNKNKQVYETDSRSYWMESIAGTEFTHGGKIAELCDTLADTLAELAKTPFNDVVVTDYMSKWVNLDAATLQIIDNSTGAAIWTAADGWLIEEGRPTAQEVPVVVELVDPADYADGGDDVVGNTNGDIYKLTWYVKDGAMLRADTYSMKYEITVDIEEAGIESDVEYPANGNTDMNYKDESGEDQSVEIDVPTVNYVTEDMGDEDVPLGPTPGGNENIEDEDVPKADVPKTGSMMLAAMSVMATSGAAMMFFRKKKD